MVRQNSVLLRPSEPRDMREPIRLVALVAWLIISVLISPSSRVEAQVGATSSPAFEVVSIKLNKTVGGEPQRRITPGNFAYTDIFLAEYIKLAFGITNRQLLGPRWIYEDRYDIVGKASSPAREDEILLMLRTLLIDRFQLKFHRENREAPVYALLVGKNGPTFRASEADSSPERVLSKDAFLFVKGSMADLAATLNSFVDRIVVDQTELAGLYDFKLNFSDLAGNSSASLYGAIEASIPSALQSLGLKLEPQTATVEFVVIDEIARVRTAN
jgi:uncharacterized protein (TIGR03435 family)